MKLLLDTNVLVDLLRSDATALTQLREATEQGAEFTTSAVAIAEIYAGIRDSEKARTLSLLGRMPCFEVSRSIGQRAGEMKSAWSRRGKTLTLTNTMIAATALEHGLLLMTKNKKDFPEDDLLFYPAP